VVWPSFEAAAAGTAASGAATSNEKSTVLIISASFQNHRLIAMLQNHDTFYAVL
jgi:hypothetical protein